MDILKEVKKLQKTYIRKKVEERLEEFSSFKNKSNKEWFSELCFCILTANSKAKTALAIQKELGYNGFANLGLKNLTKVILRNKHRFHNNKARFIVLAREYRNIKDILTNKNLAGEDEKREWLVKNIKGLGYKEASHFLRNVGYFNLAILDRHILGLMGEKKGPNKKNYLRIEKKFQALAKKLKMSCAELDLYMWYIKTGEVLK